MDARSDGGVDDRPRVGRRRDPALDGVIRRAAEAIVDEEGLDHLSIEAVARRAGVTRATVYRRWPNKNALVQELLEAVALSVSIPDHGDIRMDLVDLLTRQLRFMERDAARLYPSLSVSAAGKAFNELVVRRKTAITVVLERAIERHELRSDVDCELAFFLLWGPVYYRYMIAVADGTRIEPRFVSRLVDDVVTGLIERG